MPRIFLGLGSNIETRRHLSEVHSSTSRVAAAAYWLLLIALNVHHFRPLPTLSAVIRRRRAVLLFRHRPGPWRGLIRHCG